jgi:hypothetical protein
LLLSVDPDLRIVREREYTGYAMRAADLIELAVARRVETGQMVEVDPRSRRPADG